MRVFILGFMNSHIYEETTAMQLARDANFFFKRGLVRSDDYSKDDVLIRFGDCSYASYDKLFGRVINNARAIRRNCNKLHTHMNLWNNGFRVPKPFLTDKEIEETDLPIMRREVRHSRASDIKLITSMNNFIEGNFYTEFIPNDVEYRFHIMFNQCLRISKKVPKKEAERISDYIRSSTTGWTLEDSFKHNIGIENQAIKECIKAVSFLGLDFGACDVVISKDNLPYLLEVNTCPRLGQYGRQVYAKEFLTQLELPMEDINLSKVKEFEFADTLMMKYRKAMKHKPSLQDFKL